MKLNARLLIGVTLFMLLVAGVYAFYIRHTRHKELAAFNKEQQLEATGNKHSDYKDDPDDLVFLKAEHPMSLADEKSLKGRMLWVSAAGQMDYYPYNGHTVDFAHSQGVLLGAEKILVQDAILQQVPAAAAFRIPRGNGHVMLVFTLPDKPETQGKQYVVSVGSKDGADFSILTDQIFFYDDPHKLFAAWGPQVWQAIDHHEVIKGMSEREVQMALGQISVPHGDRMGDRMVEFPNGGHGKMITFEGNKATEIRDEK